MSDWQDNITSSDYSAFLYFYSIFAFRLASYGSSCASSGLVVGLVHRIGLFPFHQSFFLTIAPHQSSTHPRTLTPSHPHLRPHTLAPSHPHLHPRTFILTLTLTLTSHPSHPHHPSPPHVPQVSFLKHAKNTVDTPQKLQAALLPPYFQVTPYPIPSTYALHTIPYTPYTYTAYNAYNAYTACVCCVCCVL